MKSNKRSSQNKKRSSQNRKNNKKSNSSSKDSCDRHVTEINNEFGVRLNDDVYSRIDDVKTYII